ncbi:hypothetical protein BGX28_008598 [Mortierella sp. GBA30]|nr:hypothetical protein BGX28_008598 [Mortierella sp. GBA30]
MTAISSEDRIRSNGDGTGHHKGYLNTGEHASSAASGAVAGETPVTFANDTFSHLTLYTGNTMRTGTTGQLNTSLKKSNQELVSAVQETLLYSLNTARIKGDSITVTDETSLGPLDGDRSSYEITGKMPHFLSTFKMFYLSSSVAAPGTPLSVEQLNVAIANLESALGLPGVKVDHFILSLPNQTFDENDLDESEVDAFRQEIETGVLPLWTKLSELRSLGRIGRLGVAEFSKQQLAVLKQVALREQLAVPEVDQVNLQDCCVLPKDLISYAKEEGIELLTHGDSTDILPQETFRSLLQTSLPAAAAMLRPNFVVKYSAFITCRGLITKKGYIVNASSA